MELSRTPILLCLVGPAGVGKSTIAQRLVREGGSAELSVSMTSRSPRVGEVNGVHYHFVSRAAFEANIKDNQLIEWEEVHGNLYGTPKVNIERARSAKLDLLFDIDIKGALALKGLFPTLTSVVFILPPSKAALVDRMINRAEHPKEEVARRLETAEHEFKQLQDSSPDDINYVVVNNNLEATYKAILSIYTAERYGYSKVNRDSMLNIWS